MTRPGLEGDWSVKDVVAHITQYERWLLEWLREALTGVEPPPDEQTHGMTLDERNAWVYQQNRDRPMEVVLGESREVYPQLMELLQAAPEVDLVDPRRFAWTNGEALWDAVEGDAYGHYRNHTEGLLAWLAEQRGNSKPE